MARELMQHFSPAKGFFRLSVQLYGPQIHIGALVGSILNMPRNLSALLQDDSAATASTDEDVAICKANSLLSEDVLSKIHEYRQTLRETLARAESVILESGLPRMPGIGGVLMGFVFLPNGSDPIALSVANELTKLPTAADLLVKQVHLQARAVCLQRGCLEAYEAEITELQRALSVDRASAG